MRVFLWFIGMTIIVLVGSHFMSVADTTTPKVIVTRPAVPKVVRHRAFVDIRNFNGVDEYIGQCIRDGYIIKTVAASNNSEYDSNWIVIAEKY